MKDEAAELGVELAQSFGSDVNFKFVDVTTSEMQNYPQISSLLNRVRLPLTVINGEPRFHGGLSIEMISEAIKQSKNKN